MANFSVAMFRHRGKNRTYIHNLKLASLLSFVAGIVNVTGFFSVQKLTTNVTGHFAGIADQMLKKDFRGAGFYLLFILFFLLGAFVSNMLVETTLRKEPRYASALPVSAEIIILTTVALLHGNTVRHFGNEIACMLLFAMGLQNALVTNISKAIVRTTHLTGLFTDLGIELSQLFFYRQPDQRQQLSASVKLRLAIIGCFFLGGMAGGWGFFLFDRIILLLAVGCLLAGLTYDNLKYRILLYRK
ncbi:YoaK family protein [Compostibacter hankyongensis]|uniref:YoaK family protein n=1 Tax=Compostibacter hankyongensis TaxID=1007089 RepID=A0ABP8FTW6_9BACT